MASQGPLGVVVVAKNPDPQRLAWTIDRVGDQDYPVKEVVVVDSSDEPASVRSGKVDVRVLHRPEAGIGEARQIGIDALDTEYVAMMDSDSVLLSETYFSQAINRLQQPDVSAAGGMVYPIDDNVQGRAVALLNRFNPTTYGVRTLVFRRSLCTENRCFFDGQNRGEDVTMRRRLKESGRIARMDTEATATELPTTRQSIFRDIIVGTVTGAVAGAATSYIRDFVRDAGSEVTEQVEKDLSQ